MGKRITDDFSRIAGLRHYAPHKKAENIYQVYPASFMDANGDGHGDLRGIASKLTYIKTLGAASTDSPQLFDAIWMTPICQSPPGPEGDGGYAVTDYRRIDPRFGTMEDFDALLEAAHGMGLKIYIDMPIAHTSHQHEWFEKSRRREEPYTDFYVWHDGAPPMRRYTNAAGKTVDIPSPPNNWKSVFGGEAWSWDETRQQYYMHHFLKSQPKLHLNMAKVQDAMLAEMKFWLDRGVDGIRLDALPYSNHDEVLRNNPWADGMWPRNSEAWDEQYFAHSMCQEQTVDFVARIRALMDSYPQPKMSIGEVIAGRDGGRNDIPVAHAYMHPEKGLYMSYTTASCGMFANAHPEHHRYLKWLIHQLAENFPRGGHCNSISNHDFWRTAERATAHVAPPFHAQAIKLSMALLLTAPGSITLYQGEELGLPHARIPEDIPFDRMKDPIYHTKGPEYSRDNVRTPMPWAHDAKNAGFSTAEESRLFLPIPKAHFNLAVSRQHADPASHLNFMRQLVGWRKDQPALLQGDTTVIDTPHPLLAYVRRSREQVLLCYFNLSEYPFSFKPADALTPEILEAAGLSKDDMITLEPYGYSFKGDLPPTPHTAPSVRMKN